MISARSRSGACRGRCSTISTAPPTTKSPAAATARAFDRLRPHPARPRRGRKRRHADDLVRARDRDAALPLAHRASAPVPLAGRARRPPRRRQRGHRRGHIEPRDDQPRRSGRAHRRPQALPALRPPRRGAQPGDARRRARCEVRCRRPHRRHDRRWQSRTLPALGLHLAAALHRIEYAELCRQARLGPQLRPPRKIQPAQPRDACFRRVERPQIGRRIFHLDARPEPRLETAPRRSARSGTAPSA